MTSSTSSTKHSRQISSRKGLVEAIASLTQPLVRSESYHPICFPVRRRCDYSFDNLLAIWLSEHKHDDEWQQRAKTEYEKYDLNVVIDAAQDAFVSCLVDTDIYALSNRAIRVEFKVLDGGDWISLESAEGISFVKNRYDWAKRLRSRQHWHVLQVYKLVNDLTSYLEPDKVKRQLEANASQYVFEDLEIYGNT